MQRSKRAGQFFAVDLICYKDGRRDLETAELKLYSDRKGKLTTGLARAELALEEALELEPRKPL